MTVAQCGHSQSHQPRPLKVFTEIKFLLSVFSKQDQKLIPDLTELADNLLEENQYPTVKNKGSYTPWTCRATDWVAGAGWATAILLALSEIGLSV